MADETGKVVNPHGNEGQADLMEAAYGHLPKEDWPGQYPITRDDSPPNEPAATRYNQGKPQLSYLLDAPRAFEGYCRVMEHGAQKYGRYNWQKGLDEDEIIDSLIRHLQARKRGEVFDTGSGLDHYFHVICNAVFLAEQHGASIGVED